MANRLPNELIRKILLPGLHVPDIMFRDVSPKSPFFRLSHQPTSVVLLVCKSWKAVATPLLYQVVILRSKAQVLALQRTLRAHRDFGAFVRKLRVEGGFGAPMNSIITCSPNITDLCLSLDVRSSDSVAGLVRSLDTINPTCLVIVDPRETESDNLQLNGLVSRLTHAFEKWTNLNEVYVSGMEDHIYRWFLIASTLSKAKNLHTVTIPFTRCTKDTLQELKKCPSLELIRIVDMYDKDEEEKSTVTHFIALLDCVHSDPKLLTLVKFEVPPLPCVLIPDIPVLNTAYIPMSSASDEVRDLVWSRVLFFVFESDTDNMDGRYTHRYTLSHSNHNNNKVSRVSKTFHRLSFPYIYGFLTFLNDKSLQKYTSSVQQNPSLGNHLRSLQILPSVSFPNPGRFREHLHIIIQNAPNLTRLHAAPPPIKYIFRSIFEPRLPITLDAFRALAQTSGPRVSSILGVDILGGPEEILCPSVLHQFQGLRSLRCMVRAVFDLDAKKILQESLPVLESLKITYCTPSFLRVLSVLFLPSLREFEVKFQNKPPFVTAFLTIHGSKIEKLGIYPKNHLQTSVFDLCPNMKCLTIYFSLNTDDKQYLSKATHAYLTKLIFNRIGSTPPAVGFPEYILTLKLSNFPALREIQVLFLDWPVTEFDISRSRWPECSEVLASQNVKLTDGGGLSWRSRLKVHKA